MRRTTTRSIPLIVLLALVLVPASSSTATLSDVQARVKVVRSNAFLRDDGRVGISVRAVCDPGLQAFELDVGVRQGSVFGSTTIVQAGVIVCDGAWHSVRVKVAPFEGSFLPGRATVDVFLGVFDPAAADLEATATATVCL